MPPDQILSTLTEILEYQLGVDKAQVIPSAHLFTDLGADSLDHVEIIMEVEEEFGIQIRDEDAEKIQTVQDAVSYLEAHLPG